MSTLSVDNYTIIYYNFLTINQYINNQIYKHEKNAIFGLFDLIFLAN
jgi:hypothetical protein